MILMMKKLQIVALILIASLGASLSLGESPSKKIRPSSRKLEAFAILGFKSIEKFESTILAYFKGSEQEESAEVAAGMLAQLKVEEEIPGLNPHRPLGVIFYGDHKNPKLLPFFPIEDQKQFLKICELFFPKRKKIESDFFELQGDFSSFLKFQNNYAFLSTDKSALQKSLPDPLISFPRQAQAFDFAIHADLTEFPKRIGEKIKSEIQEVSLRTAVRFPDESDASFSKRMSESQFNASFFNGLIDRGRNFTLGGTIDAESYEIDLTLLAASSNSSFGNLVSQFIGKQNRFGSLHKENSILSVSGSFSSDSFVVKTYLKWVDDVRTLVRDKHQVLLKEKREFYEKINHSWKGVALLQEMIQKRIKHSQFNMSFDLGRRSGDSFELAFVSQFPNAKELDLWLQEMVPIYMEMGIVQEANNERAHKGVRIYAIAPNLEGSQLPYQIFGSVPIICVGVGKSEVFLTVGESALPLMVRSIDKAKAGAGGKFTEFSLSYSQALPFMSKFALGQGMIQDIGKQIDGTSDRLSLKARATPSGVRAKIHLQKGFNKVISKMFLKPILGF